MVKLNIRNKWKNNNINNNDNPEIAHCVICF